MDIFLIMLPALIIGGVCVGWLARDTPSVMLPIVEFTLLLVVLTYVSCARSELLRRSQHSLIRSVGGAIMLGGMQTFIICIFWPPILLEVHIALAGVLMVLGFFVWLYHQLEIFARCGG